jgi:hypothetical protein
MPICPGCKSEYREGFTHCVDCDLELVSALPDESRELEQLDSINLVKLAGFSTVAEAEMMQELLEDNGIGTLIRGETDPIGIPSGAARIELLVAGDDLARSTELYEAFCAGEPLEEEPQPPESE